MWMRSLSEFIENSQDKREVQRALAVKMLLEGYTHVAIQSILDVSSGFISKWKKAFFTSGVEGLKLRYKGSQGFLNPQQRAGVIEWLKTKDKWNLSELEYEIASSYGVVFESKQSYYNLFDAAGISWKKTQAHNPKYDEELVASKKKKSVSCSGSDVLKSSQES
ncbi:helix-turn-helix domain-containing protein [Nostoc sp.]|uniref:helix-turn-helix domain-containing protein n=1 Tax=Nostoc sp. TaxID=1180 RepID=UPI002FF9F090